MEHKSTGKFNENFKKFILGTILTGDEKELYQIRLGAYLEDELIAYEFLWSRKPSYDERHNEDYIIKLVHIPINKDNIENVIDELSEYSSQKLEKMMQGGMICY